MACGNVTCFFTISHMFGNKNKWIWDEVNNYNFWYVFDNYIYNPEWKADLKINCI